MLPPENSFEKTTDFVPRIKFKINKDQFLIPKFLPRSGDWVCIDSGPGKDVVVTDEWKVTGRFQLGSMVVFAIKGTELIYQIQSLPNVDWMGKFVLVSQKKCQGCFGRVFEDTKRQK